VLTLRGELDQGPFVEVSDLDAFGDVAALLAEPCYASAGCTQFLAEPAMGNLEV
jgi:hypothetical protein